MGFSNLAKPKRSLGQNFFTNQNLGEKIVYKTLENNPKRVVEIGPGKGFFTKIFVQKGIDVIAIEKDNFLSQELSALIPKITIFNEDVFSKKIEKLFKEKTEDTVCFGSLPYNISKKIISYLAQNSEIDNFYFIIQKEVAEKYASETKNSLLSITAKLYFDSKIIYKISPENFKPKPKVDSCFVKFSRNDNLDKINNLDKFLKYLHKAFKQPRKKIKNNLTNNYFYPKDITTLLNKRAEDLSLQEHLFLFEKLKPKTI